MAPSAPISFRPYFNLSALYSSGAEASVRPDGTLASSNLAGAEAAVGLYGYHGWKRTVVGVNYRGDFRRYNRGTSYDGTNQLLSLGVTHKPSRKVTVSFRQGAGTFSQNTGYMGTFGFFDPTFAQIPQNELLDTRTDYLSSMGDLTYMRTPRLSFNFGGTGFIVRRHVSAFYGVTGVSARADASYRVTRGSTLAADYFFSHFSYSKVFGAADMHSAGLNYSVRLSSRWELGLRAGVIRMEMLSSGAVAVDPLVAAIIGQSRVFRAFYGITTMGSYSVQLQRRFRRASLSARYDHGASPGNGVYLTSRQNTANASYSYTGLRRWSLTASAYYSDMQGIGQEIGSYRTASGGFGASRSISSRNVFFTTRFDVRRYLAGPQFRRNSYYATVGVAYSPGDVPLRLW